MTSCTAEPDCTYRGRVLYFPEPNCPKHRTRAQWDLMDDLIRRGPAVGVAADDRWPYGPNVYVDSRRRLVEWAEATGYRLAEPNGHCMHWLVGKYRRCRALDYSHPSHYRLGTGTMDHTTFWTRDGKPALALAQPYDLPGADWVGKVSTEWGVDIELVEHGPWYGSNAHGILVTPKAGA